MTRLLKNLFNQKSASWILSLAMIVATVGGPLALLLPTSSTQAQNAQNTDIFTGQFIPAYLGAAYDPTEAYKVMAGMTVYVFAYDRWSTIVNNYVHQSQVKADGSFQAAGLPNASHYGICVTSDRLNSHNFFRAPEPEDSIQSAFAYNLQALTVNDGMRSQLGTEDDTLDGKLKACKTFTTSSRLADIKNHVNIFPLVPRTVLSVIIKDQLTNDSFYNNGPYEVYAQRISTSSVAYAAPVGGVINEGSPDEITTKTGPIIRGRSIKLDSTHTIFQAFAPEGNYAITYWRPDSRNANAQISYLTYDGVSSLGTSQNGIAFESVYKQDEQFSIDDKKMSSWEVSKYIPTTTTTKNPWKNIWNSSLGSINIWGVVTGTNSGIVRPQSGKYVSTNSTQLGFYDIPNGRCIENSPQRHHSNSYGVYLLTSACPSRTKATEDGSITTTISVLRDATATAEISSISVSVNGKEGPARRDISLIDIPDSALTGNLTRDNGPFSFARVDLKIGNTLYKKVAQADSTGFFYIPQHYFTKNPNLPHQIIATPSYDPPNFNKRYQNTYAIDSQTVLALSQGKGANYNTIAINQIQPSQLQTMLANLTLDNLLAQIRIPSILAQTTSINYSKESFEIDGSKDGAFILYLNLDTLGKSINVFNSANYHLRTVELNPPTDVKSLSGEATSSTLDEHQELFDRHEGTYGVITAANAGSAVEDVINSAGDGNDPKDNSLIVGVALKSTDPDAISQLFKDYGTTSLNFNLRLSFQYRGGASTTGIAQIGDSQLNNTNQDTLDNLNGLVGQDASSAPPQVLEASWPITLTWAGEGSNSYEVKYDPIALTPAAAKCQSGSWNNLMGFFEGLLCKTVMGGINLTQQAISWIADKFLIVDPLNTTGSGIVIKYWNVMRNFVNSLAVLILVASGIAIMMRYEPKTFRIQNVITKLIIAIVLVNFSILIIQLILDIINVFALGGFYMLIDSLGSNGTAISAGKAATSLATIFAAQIIAAMAVPGPGWIGMMVAIFGVILLFGYVIFKIMIHYYLRLAVIWFCIILAPFAFAANILPNTKSLFTKWRGIFTGAVLAQVALAVILSLSYSMISTLTDAKGLMDTILTTLMAFGLLYLATIVPAKASAMFGTDLASGLGNNIKKAWGVSRNQFKTAALKRNEHSTLTNYRNRQKDKELGIEGESKLKRAWVRNTQPIRTGAATVKSYVSDEVTATKGNVSNREASVHAAEARAAAADAIGDHVTAQKERAKAVALAGKAATNTAGELAFRLGKAVVKPVSKGAKAASGKAYESFTNISDEERDKQSEALIKKAAATDINRLANQVPGYAEGKLQQGVEAAYNKEFDSIAEHLFGFGPGKEPNQLKAAKATDTSINSFASPIDYTATTLGTTVFKRVTDKTTNGAAAAQLEAIIMSATGSTSITNYKDLGKIADALASRSADVTAILSTLGIPEEITASYSGAGKANLLIKALTHPAVLGGANAKQWEKMQEEYRVSGSIA